MLSPLDSDALGDTIVVERPYDGGVTLNPGNRIDLIRESATLLDKVEFTDLDLILTQHGLPAEDRWDGAKRDYAIAMTQSATDEQLIELHTYLTGSSGQARTGDSPFKTDRTKVFLNHLTLHRDMVGEVGRVLTSCGIDAFVAHDSIEPSKEWQSVIESGLTDCDALVAFFHSGFQESAWCDQEIGWVMGRNRPILSLTFDVASHGFVSKFQSLPVSKVPAHQLPAAILNWMTDQKTLQPRLAASFTSAFGASQSFNQTRYLAALLPRVSGYTEDQLQTLETAAERNVDVSDAVIGGTRGPAWVARFVSERRAPVAASTNFSWTAETPF